VLSQLKKALFVFSDDSTGTSLSHLSKDSTILEE
jgi:hypothetical protein